MEFISSANSDITKKKYFEKLSESAFLRSLLNLSAETKQSAGEQNNMTIGQALKTERKCKRFNKNQKDFLVDKFNIGLKTGRKEVTSFFSRMNKQNKYLEDDVEARREIEIDKIRQEILNE